jgi:hypothetical protein
MANADKMEIGQRLKEIDAEWDIERLLEFNASILMVVSILVALFTRKWKALIVPLGVASFLWQHAVQGWCPPIPIFRGLGVRTQGEILTEKLGLKALAGKLKNFNVDKITGEDIQNLLDSVRLHRSG